MMDQDRLAAKPVEVRSSEGLGRTWCFRVWLDREMVRPRSRNGWQCFPERKDSADSTIFGKLYDRMPGGRHRPVRTDDRVTEASDVAKGIQATRQHEAATWPALVEPSNLLRDFRMARKHALRAPYFGVCGEAASEQLAPSKRILLRKRFKVHGESGKKCRLLHGGERLGCAA